LFKFQEGKNFNRPDEKAIGTGIQTSSILRINPPKHGGGLKFELDPRGIGFAFHRASEEIGHKGGLCKGLNKTVHGVCSCLVHHPL
jgi:hypothetical protein